MKLIKLDSKDITAILLFILMISLEYCSVSYFKTSDFNDKYYSELFILVIRLSYTLTLFKLYSKYLKEQWEVFKRNFWKNALFCLAFALLTFVLMFLAKKFITPIKTIVEIVENSTEEDSLLDLPWREFSLMLIASLTPLCAPFFEEIIFRHILFFKQIDTKLKYLFYILLSSFLFGAIHYSNAGIFINTIPYMLMGGYFAIIYWWKKNIWFNIGVHFIYNFSIVATSSLILLIFKILGVNNY